MLTGSPYLTRHEPNLPKGRTLILALTLSQLAFAVMSNSPGSLSHSDGPTENPRRISAPAPKPNTPTTPTYSAPAGEQPPPPAEAAERDVDLANSLDEKPKHPGATVAPKLNTPTTLPACSVPASEQKGSPAADASNPNTPTTLPACSATASEQKRPPAEGNIGLTKTPKSNVPQSSTVLHNECQQDNVSPNSSEAMFPLDDTTSRDALLNPFLDKYAKEKTSHMMFVFPARCDANPAVDGMRTETKLDNEMQKLVSDFRNNMPLAYQG